MEGSLVFGEMHPRTRLARQLDPLVHVEHILDRLSHVGLPRSIRSTQSPSTFYLDLMRSSY